jgi:hypothetical protein
MKPIGGYFELELNQGKEHYHNTPLALKSGRSSLYYILTLLKPELVYVPYYTCDALLEPFGLAGIRYEFYSINDSLEPEILPDLKPGELFLYVNYLDLKRETVARLSALYKDKLIVDCTQAFFMKGNEASWFFNSCRKFFGVPDGSYLYAPAGHETSPPETINELYIVDHLIKRFNGHSQEGYDSFLKNEVLAGGAVTGMSKLSGYLLSNIDYEDVIEKRRRNYSFLHNELKKMNLFDAAIGKEAVPMCYPLVLEPAFNKSALFPQDIFIPTFWQDTLRRSEVGYDTEKKLTEHLIPLPLDHRYDERHMQQMVTAIGGII